MTIRSITLLVIVPSEMMRNDHIRIKIESFLRKTTKLNSPLSRWGPALVMMAIIFTLSAIPKDTIIPNFGVWEVGIKKGGHLIAYGVLANTYLWGITRWKNVRTIHMIISILLAASYGISDELHQRFVPGRKGTLIDVGIDTLGAALGISTWLLLIRMSRYDTHRGGT